MYLSRVKLDCSKRDTMIALIRPTKFHACVEAACGQDRQRKLWRLDTLQSISGSRDLYLLFLSHTCPDLSSLQNQFGFPQKALSAQTIEYDRLLQRIVEGSCWRFRLVANPVRSSKGDNCVRYKRISKDGTVIPRLQVDQDERGRVCGHVTIAQQEEWLAKRAASHGFALESGQFAVTASKWQKFVKKDNNRVSLLAASFEGVLTVSDAELFKRTLVEGIGRGKAYGLGLLTVARV